MLGLILIGANSGAVNNWKKIEPTNTFKSGLMGGSVFVSIPSKSFDVQFVNIQVNDALNDIEIEPLRSSLNVIFNC